MVLCKIIRLRYITKRKIRTRICLLHPFSWLKKFTKIVKTIYTASILISKKKRKSLNGKRKVLTTSPSPITLRVKKGTQTTNCNHKLLVTYIRRKVVEISLNVRGHIPWGYRLWYKRSSVVFVKVDEDFRLWRLRLPRVPVPVGNSKETSMAGFETVNRSRRRTYTNKSLLFDRREWIRLLEK